MTHATSPKISVVVPVRNGEKILPQCIQALQKQSLAPEDLEIVVVDDGSTDRTSDAASAQGVRLIRQPARGASAARNNGVANSRGEIVLFTDADCRPDRFWAERLSRPLLGGAAAGAVGRCFSDQTQWVAHLIEIELIERYSRMGHQQQIDFLNTGNCGFLRGILGQNPFDESFRWLEDVELSFRLAGNGHRMQYIPDALVYHPHPQRLWVYLRRKFRYASYAPSIYRRYPGKTFSDSRTPLSRRLQLIFLGFAGLCMAAALVRVWLAAAGLVFLLASIACSIPLAARAWSRSPRLALLAPWFALMGNLAFVLGTLRGIVRRAAPGRPRTD